MDYLGALISGGPAVAARRPAREATGASIYPSEVSDQPASLLSLFEPTFVEYANAHTQGTLEAAPPELVRRVHLIASPSQVL